MTSECVAVLRQIAPQFRWKNCAQTYARHLRMTGDGRGFFQLDILAHQLLAEHDGDSGYLWPDPDFFSVPVFCRISGTSISKSFLYISMKSSAFLPPQITVALLQQRGAKTLGPTALARRTFRSMAWHSLRHDAQKVCHAEICCPRQSPAH